MREMARLVAVSAAVLGFCGVGLLPLAAQGAEACSQSCEAVNSLGLRLINYGKYQDAGMAHLPAIGVKHVFIAVPTPAQRESTMKRLADHGLSAVVMRGDTD